MAKKPTYEELEKRIQELEQREFKRTKAEEALQESEEKWRSLVRNAPSYVTVVNRNHVIEYINHPVSGLEFEDIIGHNIYEFIQPEYHDISRKMIQSVFADGRTKRYESLATGPEGTIAYYNNLLGPVVVADKIVAVAVFGLDITEQKRGEKALRENEQVLREAQKVARIGNWNWILSTGEIRWSDEMYNIYGFQKGAPPDNEEVRQFIIAEDRPIFDAAFKGLQEKHLPDNIEYRIKCCEDRIRHVVSRAKAVYDDSGTITMLIGTVQDITDRKLAENALRESEERQRQIIENSSAGYFFIDHEGRFQRVNSAWLNLHKYETAEEIIGRHYSLTQADVDLSHAHKNVEHLLDGKEIINGEFSRRCKDGSIGYHTFSARPMEKNGLIMGLEGFLIDITDRKQLEEQLRQAHKMEAIGTLAGGIAHDFNNIISIILGNTELAIDDVPEWNSARNNLEEVKTASLRAKDVVKQLLSFSRNRDPKRKPVNVSPIIKDSIKLIRSSTPANIEIRNSIPDESVIISADPTQIHQVMLNLCTNAAHAMSENGGIMEVGLSDIEISEDEAGQDLALNQGQYVKITVSDTGFGIMKEHLDKIFDPYFTTKEVGKGSGIGLSVVHGIVKDHKGAISVVSDYGEGTTFNVFLPVVEKKPAFENKPDTNIPTGNERILFVDDEKSIAKMASQMLERLGYAVTVKTSSTDTMETFRSQPDNFDLIISDMAMPNMTGDKLAKELLLIRPDIPIILCTGYSERIDDEKAKLMGVRALVMKPIVKNELAKTIRKVLGS